MKRISDPMIPANFILLGKISKIHGFEGAVTVKTEVNLSENIPAGEPVFLIIDGKPVPFFITECFIPRPGLVNLRFDDYNSPEKVKEFVGCEVFINSGIETRDDDDFQGALTGYKIKSPEGEPLGTVTEVILNPGQILLELTTSSGSKILIPFHPDLISGSDREEKEITMNLPEGLTDLN